MAARDEGGGTGRGAPAYPTGNWAPARVLDGDEVQGVLSGAFYNAPPAEKIEEAPSSKKPTHYKVICISMYTKDLSQLDALVEKLKSRGITKANRSALIRVALEQLDIEKVPRGM